MHIEPTAEWLKGSSHTLYRYLEAAASYDPDSPFATSGGRFDNGRRLTLYLASSAEGAVAEFLRRNPEFLELQDALRIQVFEVRIRIEDRGLDVRTDDQALLAGVDLDLLTSSDPDEAVRYDYSRKVADLLDDEAGLTFPSVAHAPPIWCLVLFGEEGDRWASKGFDRLPRPFVDPGDVRVLLS